LEFLEKVIAKTFYPRKTIYIQDNASYHKDKNVWEWFKENKKWLEVCNLPPYSPEFNAVERLWHFVRVSATHNRYFESEEKLFESLTIIFKEMIRKPQLISGYLAPFL
jgi:transposase